MNEVTFWAIIDGVKGSDDETAHFHRLTHQLAALSNDELVQFYAFYQAALNRANFGDLWAAGVLLNGGHGSDDGFYYFRNWLIAQGSSVYRLAISAPDTLATVDSEFEDGLPTAEWESFGYIANNVFSKRTGGALDQVARPLLSKLAFGETPPFDCNAYSNETISVRLPKLWAKYGEIKVLRDQRVATELAESETRKQTEEFDIPGLGKLKAGLVLHHQKFGPGTIMEIDKVGQDCMATISFSGAVRPMSLTAMPELFSRQPFK